MDLDPNIPSTQRTAKKAVYKKWWVWVIAILVIAGIAGQGKKSPAEASTETTSTTTESTASAPTPAETVAATSANSSSGIGVTRSHIIKTLGFKFEKQADVKGMENYTFENSALMYQILGPESSVSEASLTMAFDMSNNEKAQAAGTLLGVLAKAVCPDSQPWLQTAIKDAMTSGTTSKTFGNIKATLGMMTSDGTHVVMLGYQPS